MVQALQAEKVTFYFGVPGEENMDFMDSVHRHGLKFITTRHEQGAGFMAATVGRLTGHPGLALSTLGPGATNLATALAFAQLGGFPMLALTGQKPIKHSKQGGFQILDITGHFQEITKFSKTCRSGPQIQ
jgi:acetolactate synthase-1/2/3 large subunit